LIQLAAIPILADARQLRNTRPDVLDYLSLLTNVEINDSLSVESVVSVNVTGRKMVVGLQAIDHLDEIGIYLENVLMDYYLKIAAVAPYFETAYDLFLKSVLSSIAEYLLSGIVGPNRLSVYYLDRAKVTANLEMTTLYDILEVLRSSLDVPVIVGHGANGLLAKAVPLSIDPWRFSFEGPKLKDSPMATLANAAEESDTSRIVNFYSGQSFTATSDGSALTNHRIPKYRTGALGSIPPNPFQTFCFVAAACGSDDRFDELCADVLGESTYFEAWDKLERARVAEIPSTMRESLTIARKQLESVVG
jgi:hypothetical protein